MCLERRQYGWERAELQKRGEARGVRREEMVALVVSLVRGTVGLDRSCVASGLRMEPDLLTRLVCEGDSRSAMLPALVLYREE